ncbi:MAG: exonuclease domain-containing protein [Lachnospiraceae bacterium]|nr:exonuclease domain-containing protein [Lachnospiraceae bacterium]
MNYIVLDLEWNQSPTGKEDEMEGLPFEIIEIGAVKLNEKFEVIGEYSRTIRPQVYRRLHYKTRELLHMNMKELAHSKPFTAVVADFFAWCGTDYRICTWGITDLLELQRNMAFYHFANPLPRPLTYYDVQKLFSIDVEDGRVRRALSVAAKMLEIPETRPFHRALDDAAYTAEVLRRLNMKKVGSYLSVDYFRPPANKEEELYLKFPEYSKYVSRVFRTKEEALSDKTVIAAGCSHCRSLVWRKIRWFASGPKMYLCLVFCPRHGYVKGKLRIKRVPAGVFVVKTMKRTDEDGAKLIRDRKAEIAAKRKGKHSKVEM